VSAKNTVIVVQDIFPQLSFGYTTCNDGFIKKVVKDSVQKSRCRILGAHDEIFVHRAKDEKISLKRATGAEK
jgi:hypothetical protein